MNGYGDNPEFKFDKIQFDPFKKYIIPIAIRYRYYHTWVFYSFYCKGQSESCNFKVW